jgi:hypothetical protein
MFVGGLTTYSSFNYETMRLFAGGHWGAGGARFGSPARICGRFADCRYSDVVWTLSGRPQLTGGYYSNIVLII